MQCGYGRATLRFIRNWVRTLLSIHQFLCHSAKCKLHLYKPWYLISEKGSNKYLLSGPSPGGRDGGSRNASRPNSKQSTKKEGYSLTEVPSNMVLIHDKPANADKPTEVSCDLITLTKQNWSKFFSGEWSITMSCVSPQSKFLYPMMRGADSSKLIV